MEATIGLFSFIGGLLGAGAQKKAVNKATDAQVAALNAGIGEERRQYDTTRADFKPYLDAGTSALPQMEDLLGMNGPEKAQAAIEALKSSPVYQSLYNNGQEAVLQSASATGGIRGGNTQGALADFGRDTLSSVIADQLSRLGGMAGLGSGATDAVAGFGANSTNQIVNLLKGQGDARASGALAKGGINAGMWKSAGQFGDSIVSAMAGGAGGFGAGGAPFNLGQFLGGF